MTDDGGVRYLVRLASCPDLDALRTVWESIDNRDRAIPAVLELKNLLKARMEAESK